MPELSDFVSGLARMHGEKTREHIGRLRAQALATAKGLPEDDPHRAALFELVASVDRYLIEVADYAVASLTQGLQAQAEAAAAWAQMPDQEAVVEVLAEIAAPAAAPAARARPQLRPNVPNPARTQNADVHTRGAASDVSAQGLGQVGGAPAAGRGRDQRDQGLLQDRQHHEAPQGQVHGNRSASGTPAASGAGPQTGGLGHLKNKQAPAAAPETAPQPQRRGNAFLGRPGAPGIASRDWKPENKRPALVIPPTRDPRRPPPADPEDDNYDF